MAHSYVVTSHPASAVTGCAKGHLTGPDALNLAIAKNSHLELYEVTPEGLQPLVDVDVYGRIAVMKLFRPQSSDKDLLFISTESQEFCILSYDEDTGDLVTESAGNASSRTGRLAETGQIGIIDPAARLVCLRVYEGILKVIPMNKKGKLLEAFDIRLEHLQVLDIQFLHGCSVPTIAVLYEDHEDRHVRTYAVNLGSKELTDGPWQHPGVDYEAAMLVAVPPPFAGGALILAASSVVLHSPRGQVTLAVETKTITTFCPIDENGSRWLLGDFSGMLYMLVLVNNGTKVTEMKLQALGRTSIAYTLAYLDEGVVYVGSQTGDSQLVKLSCDESIDGSFLEVLDTYPSLGPIMDLCLVDLDKQGQNQVVACCGTCQDGSLRVLRNGIGIFEHASIDMPAVQGIYSLTNSLDSTSTVALAVSFGEQTAFLELAGEGFEGMAVEGASTKSSLYCGNAVGDCWLQVTDEAVCLIDIESKALLSSWSHPDGKAISVCSCNSSQVVVGAGAELHFLCVEDQAVVHKSMSELPHEIACVDVSPLSGGSESNLCVAGLWTDISMRVFQLPDLTELHQEVLGGEVIPRSLLMATFEGQHHLFCALGDGCMFSFTLDPNNGHVANMKRLQLGTQPIALTKFRHQGVDHVFAASDRPTIIHSSNGKLLYSNLNRHEVLKMCEVNSEAYPNSLALVSSESLTIGSIDEIQKLQIQKIELGEQPWKICHQVESSTLCLLSSKDDLAVYVGADEDQMEERPTQSFVRLLDGLTFDILNTFELEPHEQGWCNVACKLALGTENGTGDAPEQEYYCVGTAYIREVEDEPTSGRILIFRVHQQALSLVAAMTVNGAVYDLAAFHGKLLAAINSHITLYSLVQTKDDVALKADCTHRGHILVLFLKTRGDFVVVGDVMRSVALLRFDPTAGRLEQIGAENSPNWITATEIFDDDTFLAAENSYNLFTCHRHEGATTDEERARLSVFGEYHLGDLVNVLRKGTFGMRSKDQAAYNTSFLYGTASGAVGMVIKVALEEYMFLKEVEVRLKKVVHGLGGFQHDAWRSFKNERRESPDGAKNFVDGDLVEKFLELSPETMDEVVEGLEASDEAGVVRPVTAVELARRLEDLTRLH